MGLDRSIMTSWASAAEQLKLVVPGIGSWDLQWSGFSQAAIASLRPTVLPVGHVLDELIFRARWIPTLAADAIPVLVRKLKTVSRRGAPALSVALLRWICKYSCCSGRMHWAEYQNLCRFGCSKAQDHCTHYLVCPAIDECIRSSLPLLL